MYVYTVYKKKILFSIDRMSHQEKKDKKVRGGGGLKRGEEEWTDLKLVSTDIKKL